MSGVVLPPFLSLPLSSQRTLCLGSFLSFLSAFSAGLPQLSGERERRACVFGWTLLWFYWYWHFFDINTNSFDQISNKTNLEISISRNSFDQISSNANNVIHSATSSFDQIPLNTTSRLTAWSKLFVSCASFLRRTRARCINLHYLAVSVQKCRKVDRLCEQSWKPSKCEVCNHLNGSCAAHLPHEACKWRVDVEKIWKT